MPLSIFHHCLEKKNFINSFTSINWLAQLSHQSVIRIISRLIKLIITTKIRGTTWKRNDMHGYQNDLDTRLLMSFFTNPNSNKPPKLLGQKNFFPRDLQPVAATGAWRCCVLYNQLVRGGFSPPEWGYAKIPAEDTNPVYNTVKTNRNFQSPQANCSAWLLLFFQLLEPGISHKIPLYFYLIARPRSSPAPTVVLPLPLFFAADNSAAVFAAVWVFSGLALPRVKAGDEDYWEKLLQSAFSVRFLYFAFHSCLLHMLSYRLRPLLFQKASRFPLDARLTHSWPPPVGHAHVLGNTVHNIIQ